MRFSNILFLIPLVHSEPFYPSIRPVIEKHNPLPPCIPLKSDTSKDIILYKPYLRYKLDSLRMPSQEEEDEFDDEYIISIE